LTLDAAEELEAKAKEGLFADDKIVCCGCFFLKLKIKYVPPDDRRSAVEAANMSRGSGSGNATSSSNNNNKKRPPPAPAGKPAKKPRM
jgi:hypothetical protein